MFDKDHPRSHPALDLRSLVKTCLRNTSYLIWSEIMSHHSTRQHSRLVAKTLCCLVQSREDNKKQSDILFPLTMCTFWMQSVYTDFFLFLFTNTNLINTRYSVWLSFTLNWREKSVTNTSYEHLIVLFKR